MVAASGCAGNGADKGSAAGSAAGAGDDIKGAKLTFVGDDAQEFTDAEAFLKCIREELPYFPTTGFRCEVLTDDPAVRKQVDDIFYDFFGEENPHQIEDYQNEPEQDMTFGGV